MQLEVVLLVDRCQSCVKIISESNFSIVTLPVMITNFIPVISNSQEVLCEYGQPFSSTAEPIHPWKKVYFVQLVRSDRKKLL